MGERAEKINTGAGKTLRLALVDSDVTMHTAVRRHLAEVQPVWCFDAFTCGNEALKAMQAAPPQVVLLEQTLPGGCGIDYTRRFKTHLPDLPVVIFTAHGKPENLMSALLAGARGYVVKNGSLTGLVPQLQKAMSGRLALCEQAERLLPEAFARLGQGNPWGLTHREQEAMLWLCRHKSDKEISAAMGLATSTE